jgi:hypothetical protein
MAWGQWHHRLRDSAYGVDGITGLGLGKMMVRMKGFRDVNDGVGALGIFLVGNFGGMMV